MSVEDHKDSSENHVILEDSKNCNTSFDDSIQNHKTSFEELLFIKIKRGDNLLKPPRHKVALGAARSISNHSDSDIAHIKSNTASIDDFEFKTNAQIWDKENIERNVLTPNIIDSEQNEIPSYNIGDNVLLKYYSRQKWTYYVGLIENIKLTDQKSYYAIKFDNRISGLDKMKNQTTLIVPMNILFTF
ncbi:unnamed protein product [Euphydryas editha]|uniref:Tudor domain-containing protein n=1 Tax=Euphydryas editha TaxID=104508 RepID=A0AAU9TU95_EUPED|nr:unnamed protein product [Euphydryas editha]